MHTHAHTNTFSHTLSLTHSLSHTHTQRSCWNTYLGLINSKHTWTCFYIHACSPVQICVSAQLWLHLCVSVHVHACGHHMSVMKHPHLHLCVGVTEHTCTCVCVCVLCAWYKTCSCIYFIHTHTTNGCMCCIPVCVCVYNTHAWLNILRPRLYMSSGMYGTTHKAANVLCTHTAACVLYTHVHVCICICSMCGCVHGPHACWRVCICKLVHALHVFLHVRTVYTCARVWDSCVCPAIMILWLQIAFIITHKETM